jgi:chromosome segregation ATPase
VSEEVKEVWDSLSRSDKLVLTRFFRDAIAGFSSVRAVLTLGMKDLAELASILRVGYESCKDALRRCEERCTDIEEVRRSYREKIEELENRLADLQNQIKKKDDEIAKLRNRLKQVEDLTKLSFLVCSLLSKDKLLAEELKKTGLIKLCG